MHFRDVVICDSAPCGAILRISDRPGPICVPLQASPRGTFVVCPRCGTTTVIEANSPEGPPTPPQQAAT
jgi:hypothetical protein